jgi:hypothetical protein
MNGGIVTKHSRQPHEPRKIAMAAKAHASTEEGMV